MKAMIKSPRNAGVAAFVLVLVGALLAGIFIGAYVGPTLSDWLGMEPQRIETAATRGEAAQLWTCGMHPQVLQEEPGFCPICGMELTPLRADPADVHSAGTVVIDPVVVQNMGVRTATVVEGPLRRTIRAAGVLEEAQPRQHDVSLRVSGWIERLYADTEGMHLQQGTPVFELYSPELQLGMEELIAARRARDSLAPDSPASARAATEALHRAAERKLRLWGLDAEEVRRLARLDRAPETVTFSSPVSGHLVEKPVVEGSAVQAGERVLRIVDHGVLWLDAQVFEQHLPFIRLGQSATATMAAMPGTVFEGQVVFIHPHVDEMARTALVRFAIANPALDLRPGTFATVQLETERTARAILVPREAVIDTGLRQMAFVPLERGHFEPRQLTLGAAGDDGVMQVIAGLAPGEQVVISGQFLLDAESRFQEAVQKHLRERLTKSEAGKAPVPEERHHAH